AREVRSPSALEIEFVEVDEADWGIIPSADRTEYGYSVASAGNVDGYPGDDILVGARKDESIDGKGAAYLYLNMGAGLNTVPAWSAGGGEHAVNFGSAVAGAGDVNHDGIADAVIADEDYKTELSIKDAWKLTQAGGAFVYAGVSGMGLSAEPIWSFAGEVQAGKFASSVAGAGDLNGDGVDDIVVGARLYTDKTDNTENSEGAIYVFFGHEGLGPSTEPDWLIDGDQPGALLGYSVSAAGDVNDDGYDDLLVGAPGYVNPDPESGVQEGAALLFLGGEAPPASVAEAAWVAYGGQEDSDFGTVVAGAGDVNGDGHPDIVVSATGYRRPSDDALVGAAFAYCGNGEELGADPCWKVTGSQPGAGFGASASGAGDVDADDFDDVIVGAPTYIHYVSDDYHPEGAAFIYFGSETGLSTWAAWKGRGDKSRTDFGASVSSAGNVGGGGYDGVIIGAPQYFKYEGTPYGAAFAYYGPLEPAELFPAAYLPLIMSNAN
ncbi:MAG: integrin alpha, partial [Anaerolineae bacterium]